MIARPRLARLTAISVALYLIVPLCVGSSAQTQTRDSRQPADEVSIDVTMAPAIVPETEPNGTAGTADSIATQLAATRYVMAAGAINPGGDLDYFTFSAAAGSRIWLVIDTGGFQNAGATDRDTVLDLLAADGTTVIESDDNDGTGNGGDGGVESGLASVIAGRTLTAGGTYFIRVRSFSPAGIINPYRLFVVNTAVAPTAEVENNNTAAVANTAVAMSASLSLRSASIGAIGDVDYYSVAATTGSVIYFAVDADPERDGAGTDVAVDLRSSDDVQLLAVDSGLTNGSIADPTAEGANFTVLRDGVYYIRVRHFNNSATGTYHLMTAVSVPAEDEPNDTPATAEAIVFTSPARRSAIIAGTINPGGDADFYSFQAAAGSRVWIATDTGGTQNPGATSRNTIIDVLAIAPGGEFGVILERDDDDGTGNGGDGTIETGQASLIGGKTLVVGGTYYIRVQASDNTAIINPYKLFVVLTNSQTLTAAESESNNTAATADVLTDATPIGVRTAAIGSAGDADYYSIVADAGSIVYFNVDADPERDDIGTDLLLEFRSPADVLLLSVDSSFAGSAADPPAEGATFIVADTGGTYYLKVRHYAPGGTGTYHVMAIAASGNGLSGFTDSPVTAAVTTIRAVHFTELRTRINALRARFGLGAFAWSHTSLAGAVIDADDMAELRTALGQAYTAAGMTAPAYSDAVIVPQSTVIKALHIEQLRAAVIALESS
jgi:hypothetical protein